MASHQTRIVRRSAMSSHLEPLVVVLTAATGLAAMACQPETASIAPANLRKPTTTLDPEPIDINLDDLPEPYASDSARQSPRVVDIPDDATLAVPEGFAVNVFAGDLDQPRWLALTPDRKSTRLNSVT